MKKLLLPVRIILAAAILGAFVPSVCLCQSSNVSLDALTDARVDWHLAGLAESRQQWQEAEKYYDRVSLDVTPVTLAIREWYRASSAYGKALCAGRRADCAAARDNIEFAAQHHFWNFALLRSDSSLIQLCKGAWLDSLASYWEKVRVAEQDQWLPQTSIVLYPERDSSSAEDPVIIALHGGNACYAEFAEYWRAVANEQHVIVVIPPGCARESETTNSWGYDMAPIEEEILAVAASVKQNRVGDSNRIYLAGYSQGAQASLEIGILHPDLFCGIISICGFVNKLPETEALHRAAGAGMRIYAIEPEFESADYRGSFEREKALLANSNVLFREQVVKELVHEMPLDFSHQFAIAWSWLYSTDLTRASGESSQSNRHTSE